MFECEICGSSYPTEQLATECCMPGPEQPLDLTQGQTKQQFIYFVQQMQKDMDNNSICKLQFQNVITSTQYGQFLWQTYKRYGALNQEQLRIKIQGYMRNVILQRLYYKGLVQIDALSKEGQPLYRRTISGVAKVEQMTQKQKMVYEHFFKRDAE